MNASVMIGDRFQGVGGVLACLLGQMAMPLVIVTSLAVVYQRFAAVPEVKAALIGAAAGASGLVLGTALKMAQKIKPSPLALAVGFLAFAAIGILAMAARSGGLRGGAARRHRRGIGAARMTAGILIQIARVFAVLSLVSIGGANAVLPEIRRQIVDVQGWMNDARLRQSVRDFECGARPQHHPGQPDRLATRRARRASGRDACDHDPVLFARLLRGPRREPLVGDSAGSRYRRRDSIPVTLGLILASGISMMRTADHDALTIAISLATAVFVVFSRRNPLWAIATGTAVSIAALHFGLMA